MTLEPRGLLATWDPVRTALTVYGASKVAHANRRFLARMIGLEERAIELVENDVGGAFGVRGEFYPEDFLIPFAARALGRPVKWIEDRRENLMAANHARDAHCELEIACTREGRIIGLRGEAVTDIGAYMRTNGVTPSRNIAQVCSGPYRIENIRVGVTLLLTNKTPVGTYRGPGRFETDFFRERLFDIAAAEMGIDRVEFRRRNLIAEADMPYALAELKPYSGRTACDSGDYGGSLERCLNEFDWTGKQALNGQCIAGRYHGIGLGCYIEGGGSGPRESARLVLETDGRVSVYVGSSSVGQGIETSLAQIAADALGLPFEGIRAVYHGSTAHVREGFGAYSSRCVVQGGSAIVLAAGELLKRLSAEAARQLGCSEQQLSRQPGGWQSAAGRSIGWKTLGQSAPFEAEATFSSQARTYSYGAHAAHVAVDSRTGAIEVLDYVAVEDVGRVINPLILHGQTQGAIVQGMGGVFLEQLVYDAEGQLLTGSFADYLLPTASGIPPMTIVATGDKPSPHNPLGAKGAGEGGIIAVGGVLANAVSAALARFGVQANDLPLSPARIWALINAQRPPGPNPEQP
jgi:carbon-monoxide dehydrogenase large subunit